MRRIVTPVIVLALGALLSACGSSSSPSSTSTSTSPAESPKAELAAMRKAAHTQHSVHYESVNSAPGSKIQTVTDAGMSEGIQRITVTDHGQTGPATVIFTGGTAYLRGNAFTMHVYFGFPQAQATKYGGKWIAVPSSSPAITTIAAGVTFPSFLSSLFTPMTKLTYVSSLAGLVGVHGTVHGKNGGGAVATIFAPADGTPLPVKQTARTSGKPGGGVVTMSDWNVPVHVSAPKGAVPLANLAHGG